MTAFNPLDWYWLADDGRVFSSARQAIVSATDATFVERQAAGLVTRWPVDLTGAQTTLSLQAVLTPFGLFADLPTYAAAKQGTLATDGYTLTLSGQVLTFETDDGSRSDIMGTYLLLAQPNPPSTINWHFATGFVAVSASDFAKAATAIANFRLATFTALQAVLAAITAGSITTTAQIDAAAWPSAVLSS